MLHLASSLLLVLEEVEKKIENFRRELSKKLHVLPSTLEDQRKLIK